MKFVASFSIYCLLSCVKLSTAYQEPPLAAVQRNSSICWKDDEFTVICRGAEIANMSASEMFKTVSTAKVETLRFVDTNFVDFNFSIFDETLEKLQTLSFSNCLFLSSISFATKQTRRNLVTFEFTGNAIVSLGQEETAASWRQFATNAPNVQNILFTGNRVKISANNEEEEEQQQNDDTYPFDFSLFRSLLILDLRNNGIRKLPPLPGNLKLLNASFNAIERCENGTFLNSLGALEEIDLSNNQLQSFPVELLLQPSKLKRLNLSNNLIGSVGGSLDVSEAAVKDNQLTLLDLSHNHIEIFDPAETKAWGNLKLINLSNNPLKTMYQFPTMNVEAIDISGSQLEVLDAKVFQYLHRLKVLQLQNSLRLRSVVGRLVRHLPALQTFNLQNCSLKVFSTAFFTGATNLQQLDVSGNHWPCDCRLHMWLSSTKMPSSIAIVNENATFCVQKSGNSMPITDFLATNGNSDKNCSLGTVHRNGTIFRVPYGEPLLFDCGAYGDPFPTTTWRRVDEEYPIPNDDNGTSLDDRFQGFPDGSVKLSQTYKNDIGIYECTISNNFNNEMLKLYVRVRLAYAERWWYMKIYSVICCILVSMAFFALNAIYGAIRRLVVWRLSKLEQTSRVRMMIEAMEKYRTRQMENLHEYYTTNMNQVRDNYHQQVEQLRKTYGTQVGRFRDYRTAQFESVTQHMDNMRETYNTQMNRVRDYGSRQMERLWETYQTRATSLREFSLHQRLRLMHQYKIKQRYLNKLLENLNVENCRHPPPRVESTIIDCELMELPPMMPPGDDDLITSTSSFLMRQPGFQFEEDTGFNEDGLFVGDDDASSYHSFPDESFALPEEDRLILLFDQQPSQSSLVDVHRSISDNQLKEK